VLNAAPALNAYSPLRPGIKARLPAILAPASVREGRLSVSVLDEYLPRGADPETWRNERPTRGPVVWPGDARITVVEDGGTRISLEVDTTEAAVLRVARWAFPGWVYEVDGIPGKFFENEAGSLDLAVPSGHHRLALRLAPPWQRRVGLAVSATALVLWFVLLIRWPWRLRSASATV
jgi:hypothetical protein